MEKVYAVVWSRFSSNTWTQDAVDTYEDALASFNGVHGIYRSKASAQKALEDCKNSFINELLSDPSLTYFDVASFHANLELSGSTAEGYYDLVYSVDGCPHEIYIQITKTLLKD